MVFSLERKKGQLPRLVSLLVGGNPLVNDKYIPVYNAYSGQTETMQAKWANLKKNGRRNICKDYYGKSRYQRI